MRLTFRELTSEAIPVSGMYFGLCWLSLLPAILLLSVGLFNATLAPSERGFYAMSLVLSLFAAAAVQKNVRDLAAAKLAAPVPAPGSELFSVPAL